ncbi:Uncharacterized protein BWAI21_06101 [Bacillus mycoides]|nr:Uncharacterized protein BWAI21_06101 [Bacillus mycoides]
MYICPKCFVDQYEIFEHFTLCAESSDE